MEKDNKKLEKVFKEYCQVNTFTQDGFHNVGIGINYEDISKIIKMDLISKEELLEFLTDKYYSLLEESINFNISK